MSEATVTCQCGASLHVYDNNSMVVSHRTEDFYKAHAVCNERPAPSVADPLTVCPSCDHPWERHIIGSGVLAGERHCKPGCGCERRPPTTSSVSTAAPHRDDCVHPNTDSHGISGLCPVAQDDKGWSTLWAARPGYRRDDP